jgi:hypothetical protein
MNYAATRRNQINLLSFPFFSFFFTGIYQIINTNLPEKLHF